MHGKIDAGALDSGPGLPPGFAAPDICSQCDLIAEADHRIANHLALINAMVRLKAADLAKQSTEPTRGAVRLLLEGVRAQIGAVSRLHRSLSSNARRQSVDLGEHLHEACAPFALDMPGEIILVEDFRPGCDVRPDQILPLIQIVTEVVINALKHSQAIGEVGRIVVSCRRDEGGMVRIEVVDDGRGLPANVDPATNGGLGFRLLRLRAKRLGAAIEFEPAAPGLRFRLTLGPGAA